MTKKSASQKKEDTTHAHNHDGCCDEHDNLCSTKTCCSSSYGGCGGLMYFLGVVGSAIYFVSAAGGFWAVVLGLLKSLVWPVFLILVVFRFLGV